jgi:hypothetical protein
MSVAVDRPAIEPLRPTSNPPFELADTLADSPDPMLQIEIAHAQRPSSK